MSEEEMNLERLLLGLGIEDEEERGQIIEIIKKLNLSLEDIVKIVEGFATVLNVKKHLDDQDIFELIKDVLDLPSELEKIIPVVIPVVRSFVENYWTSIKPVVDEIEDVITQINKHQCDMTAKLYADKMDSLMATKKFTKGEAMKILLKEMETRGQTAGTVMNSLKGSLEDIVKNLTTSTDTDTDEDSILPLSSTDLTKFLSKLG